MAGGYLSVGTDGILLTLMSRVDNSTTPVEDCHTVDMKGQQQTHGYNHLIVRDEKTR